MVGRRRDETDANGKLELDLEGLGSGRRYLFSYQYGIHPTQYVRSAVVSSTGPFSFAVGTLQLQLLNGRTGAGYGNEVVALERQSGPNSWVNVRYVVTDAAGQAMLNPVGFGTNIAYRLRARSELDRSWKTTSPITDIGLVRFTVGGRGLNIAVVDGVSGAPLAGVRVAAFEQRADGSLSWRRTEESDAQGRLSLDLLGLDTGTRFVLRHQYGTHPSQFVESTPIYSSGTVTFRVGTIQARVSKPDGSHYAGESVVLEHLDGSHWRGVHSVVSDSAGRVMFSPAQLGTGRALSSASAQ